MANEPHQQIIDPGWAWNQQWQFNQAVRSGNLMFLSGQAGFKPDGRLAGDDIETQTRQAFENLKEVLAVGGLTLDDVIHLRTLHTDTADLEKFAAIKAEYITRDFPAWTVLGVASLALPGMLIEIEAIATVR